MEKEICECKRDYKSPLSGICELCWDEKYPTKQETLEEVRKYAELSYYNGDEVNAFVDGVKWQQERMLKFILDEDNYTEEELESSCIDVQTLVHFIEQYKKK